MTDRLEAQIESLRGEIGSLIREIVKATSLAEQTAEIVKEDRRKAQDDRNKIWVEVRGIGEKLISLTNKVEGMRDAIIEMKPAVGKVEALVSTVAEMKPVVENLDTGMERAKGAGWATSQIARAVAIAASAIAGGIATAIGIFSSWKHPQ